jgi:hypothetical protein
MHLLREKPDSTIYKSILESKSEKLLGGIIELTSTASVPLSIRSIFVKTPNVLSPENLLTK